LILNTLFASAAIVKNMEYESSAFPFYSGVSLLYGAETWTF